MPNPGQAGPGFMPGQAPGQYGYMPQYGQFPPGFQPQMGYNAMPMPMPQPQIPSWSTQEKPPAQNRKKSRKQREGDFRPSNAGTFS